MLAAAGVPADAQKSCFCDACFSGDYPVKFPRLKADSQLGLF
jgi:amidophosphoribosyltransferase